MGSPLRIRNDLDQHSRVASPNIVSSYVSCLVDTISDADFGDITKVLGKDDLQNLFYALGLLHQDIEKAERSADTKDVNLCAKEVLRFWRKQNGHLATRKAVIEALATAENRYGIEQLEVKWNLTGW